MSLSRTLIAVKFCDKGMKKIIFSAPNFGQLKYRDIVTVDKFQQLFTLDSKSLFA